MNEELTIAIGARDALRRIRGAAVEDVITPENMSELSRQVNKAFALAMLEAKGKNELIRSNDQLSGSNSQRENFQKLLGSVLPDRKSYSRTNNSIDLAQLDLSIRMAFLPDDHKQIERYQRETVIALLSTGALFIALLSYLKDFPVIAAATSMDRNKLIVPEILDNQKPIVIVDEVIGTQAHAIRNMLMGKRIHPSVSTKAFPI